MSDNPILAAKRFDRYWIGIWIAKQGINVGLTDLLSTSIILANTSPMCFHISWSIMHPITSMLNVISFSLLLHIQNSFSIFFCFLLVHQGKTIVFFQFSYSFLLFSVKKLTFSFFHNADFIFISIREILFLVSCRGKFGRIL